MIRYVVFFLALWLPSLTLAEINYFQLKTLLKICETAQHSSDRGTIKNIASQLKDAERPFDEILAKKYDHFQTTNLALIKMFQQQAPYLITKTL